MNGPGFAFLIRRVTKRRETASLDFGVNGRIEMTNEVFESRGTALEGEFFRRVDDELARELREEWRHQRDVELLRKESRIQDDAVLEELLYIGIEPGTLQAMTLVPAIHVAWANGFVEAKEREALLHAAKTIGIERGSTTGQLLLSWLSHEPSMELFQVWEDYVKAIKMLMNVSSFRHLHLNAITTAESIAKAAGGVAGVYAVSLAEERAIRQIDDAFA